MTNGLELKWAKIANAIKWLFDRGGDLGGVMNLFGIGPGRRTREAPPEVAKTATEERPITTNSFGSQDEEGILYLLAKYGIPPEVLKEGLEPIQPTLDQSNGLGYLFGHMTPGEMDAFKRIIARGNEQPITVKVPVPVKLEKKDKSGSVIGTEEKIGYREYTVFAAIRGSHILRSVGQDIFNAGVGAATERAKKTARTNRAQALAAEFRNMGMLKNWPDTGRNIVNKALETARPGTRAHAAQMELRLRTRLGSEGWEHITRGEQAQALRAAMESASTPQARADTTRAYYQYLEWQAAAVLDPDVQTHAAAARGIVHPNLWPKRIALILAGLVIVTVITIAV